VGRLVITARLLPGVGGGAHPGYLKPGGKLNERRPIRYAAYSLRPVSKPHALSPHIHNGNSTRKNLCNPRKIWSFIAVSRKRIPRSLPPLPEVFGDFSGFLESSNKQSLLLLELRKAARRLRKRKSQPFYSMREVAEFFKAPLRTVAIAYESLEDEGIVNRVRSSQTLLIGSADSTQSVVRGVVGIPIWLLSIVVSPFSRTFHLELEERLRKKGYVADFIFFRTGEDCQPDFAERLLRHGLNYLIWHTPHPLGSQVQLCMKDHAIRQIIIQPTESPRSQMQPNYLLNWQPAYHEMASTWSDAGISRVLIPKPVYMPSKQALTNFCQLLKSHDIETQLVEADARGLLDTIGTRPSTAVAFMDQQEPIPCATRTPPSSSRSSPSRASHSAAAPSTCPISNAVPRTRTSWEYSAAEMVDRIVNDIGNTSGRNSDTPHCFRGRVPPATALERPAGIALGAC